MAEYPVGVHVIGFLEILPDRARAIGTGALLSWGKLRGVLTADHVFEHITRFREIAILEFPVRPKQLQGTRMPTDLVTAAAVRLGHASRDESGPDVAFFELPLVTASALAANSSFLNLERQRSLFATPSNAEMEGLDAVLGLVAEWEKGPFLTKALSTTQELGLVSFGDVSPIAAGRGGLDRYRFTPKPDEDFSMPKSHGGTSGGPWIRAFVKKGTTAFDHARLMGLAYYEDRSINGKRDLICHGPESLYKHLAPLIEAKWPEKV